MEFVVHVKGEEKGFWALHVDSQGERFLLANEDGTFRWVGIADSVLVRAANPDVPRPVVPVEPKQTVAVPKVAFRNGRQ